MKFNYLEQLATQYKLVLGSGSPRRFQLLTELSLSFEVIRPEIDELNSANLPPFAFATRLAEQKAADVASKCHQGQAVMGCDTIVILDGQILGKPENHEEAIKMLTLLSGQTHTVCSAVALNLVGGLTVSGYETTDVVFNTVRVDEIRSYVATGEPLDKAGAYGIQGKGGFLVDSIRGNLDNVIGLPRNLADDLAREILKRL